MLLHEGQAQDAQEEADGGAQQHQGQQPPERGSEELVDMVWWRGWVGMW